MKGNALAVHKSLKLNDEASCCWLVS